MPPSSRCWTSSEFPRKTSDSTISEGKRGPGQGADSPFNIWGFLLSCTTQPPNPRACETVSVHSLPVSLPLQCWRVLLCICRAAVQGFCQVLGNARQRRDRPGRHVPVQGSPHPAVSNHRQWV